ncbi:hypothetical protein ACWDBD_17160 [Streptomyces sp. NPDC001118]
MTDRKTASTINDTELDQLYAENDRLTAELADYDQRVENLTRQAARTDPELRNQLAAAISALGKAETELAALRQVARGYCPACGRGDCAPTVEDEAAHAQTIDSLDRAVRRARRAEAVIEAVAEILADHNGDDWSRHPATEAVASALRLPPTPTAATQATEHVYLSTGCLHGKHDYCRSHTGLSGAKKAAVCKFCQAPCRCSCHQEQPDV